MPRSEALSIFSKFNDLVTELQSIAQQADQQRLTVLVDQFAVEFPDVYETITEMVELEPPQALTGLIQKWPMLAMLRIYPNHLRLIELIQTEIKSRSTDVRTEPIV